MNAGSRDTEENAVAADPYRTLGVAKDASQADIQKAYRLPRWRPARAERPRATMEA